MTFPVLEGKVALVTGGAMGMGQATAVLFAEAGARVVVADLDEEGGAETVEAIVAAGGTASSVKVDISRSDQVEAMVGFAVETYGRLDVAVNNAAMSPDNEPVHDFDESHFDRLISVDLTGTALCLKYELRQMRQQGGGGSIINISSTSGFRPQPNNIAYVAAKHAVNGMTKIAAMENGSIGIRVNAVAPGAIDTPMLRGALATKDHGTQADFASKLSLFGRFGQPREVAQASLWLASDQSSYVTGTVLHVDAGYVDAR